MQNVKPAVVGRGNAGGAKAGASKGKNEKIPGGAPIYPIEGLSPYQNK